MARLVPTVRIRIDGLASKAPTVKKRANSGAVQVIVDTGQRLFAQANEPGDY